MPSRFQKYWKRIDNSPGSLDYASPEQLARVKQMVRAAFHAGHGEYRNRIEQLEAQKADKHERAEEIITAREKRIEWLEDWCSKATPQRVVELEERLRGDGRNEQLEKD